MIFGKWVPENSSLTKEEFAEAMANPSFKNRKKISNFILASLQQVNGMEENEPEYLEFVHKVYQAKQRFYETGLEDSLDLVLSQSEFKQDTIDKIEKNLAGKGQQSLGVTQDVDKIATSDVGNENIIFVWIERVNAMLIDVLEYYLFTVIISYSFYNWILLN